MRMRYGTIRNIQLSLWPEEEITQIACLAEEIIGKAGRRLFIGKSMNKPPTIFNATIFNPNNAVNHRQALKKVLLLN